MKSHHCHKTHYAGRILWIFVIALGVLLLGNVTVQAGPKQEKKNKVVAEQKQEEKGKFAGSETCAGCHSEISDAFKSNKHFDTTHSKIARQHEGERCESCHGPGQAHAEAGGDKSKIFSFKTASPKVVSERCLECHEYGQTHQNFARSAHNANGVSCVGCHSVHTPKVEQAMLKEKGPSLCYSCHLDVKPQFNKPFRHRVNEGLIGCNDCHDPHGGFLSRQLRNTGSQDVACFKCHTDKAGPFVYEHSPVKADGCSECHSPHGSSNPRLLKRSTVNLLCLECHTFTVDQAAPTPPTLHNQAAKYQACTLCHTKVHGSNTSNVFFN